MNFDRQYVERRSMASAGIVEETPDWYMARVLGNIPIYCRKDDKSVTTCLINEGFWESWITAWVLNNVNGGWFIDIGANTGYYSLIAKSRGADVMAFEPNPKYVEMLRASINIGWSQSRGDWLPDNHFNVYQYALSDKAGTATLTIPKDYQGSATIREGIDEEKYPSDHIEVLCTTLDDMVASIEVKPMVIKIDAESAEEKIWDGMQETLYRYKPVVMLEYTPGAYSSEFLDKLERYGKLAWINHAGNEEPISRQTLETTNDWVMLLIRKHTQD